MEFEDFEPIFGEPKVQWAKSGLGLLRQFLFYVHASDSSHLKIVVTDFHSNTYEGVKSVLQLEDMRDSIGIGGSWSEFIQYVIASIKSEDVKLVLEGHSSSDGAAFAKLVAQKSKGMPLVSISLTKLDSFVAAEAMANLSLELFKTFKSTNHLLRQEQERSSQLTKVISAEKEKSDTIQNQLELHSKRQRLQHWNSSEKTDASALLTNGAQDSPEKQAAQGPVSTKVTNRVMPVHRRAKARVALLHNVDDDEDN